MGPMGDAVLYFSQAVGEAGGGVWVVFASKMDPQEAGFHSLKQHLLPLL